MARAVPADRAVPARLRNRRAAPTLRLERRLLRDGATRLAGMDEVGRGSPAGPVLVGVVVVDAATPPAPVGVRDSKLVVPAAREALVPRIRAWAAGAVGAAGPAEVDAVGVTGALRLAGLRALAQLDVAPDLVLLDGVHDWLTGTAAGGSDGDILPEPVRVVTKVRADRTCASVAAASILAKVARDAVMTGLSADYPDYGWHANKGYGTAAHLEALARLGPTPHHRLTWRMPGPA
ncbi:MAG TPA: ribonuclease HII [Acidimicrobiales bacterium]|nr:ribonuclease HII [Acidimicrobiales bacterium]